MKQFDLFAGYGGFTLAGENCGFETIGFSEIDKYASAVLNYHWPNIKNYGDITKINWAEVPDFYLLTGGSPCQDLSIAGKRAGLDGARSGLFYEYMRAIKEKKPKYFIWENGKGALSSSKGWDFATVLNEMAEAGYSLWWQVLNAKYFGVPQNRERIFVVGFRDGCDRQVFFEQRKTEENNIYSRSQSSETPHIIIPEATKQGYAIAEEGDSINLSVINSKTRRGRIGKGIAQTVDTGMQQYTMYKKELGSKQARPCVISQLNNPVHSNDRIYGTDGISPTLNTAQGGNRQPFIPEQSRIRRLTPVECERLMDLPDGHTSAGGTISDSQRYKMCGNGVVVNVVEEIIKTLIL